MMIKNVIRHNKIKTHEIEENKKVEDIRKNNAHLLDKLLEISKGKHCKVSQQNCKVKTAPSRSLNYVNKKKEADRIDRENQKIMDRIINVKPQLTSYEKMRKDYRINHL